MVYKWKNPYFHGDAQAAGEMCRELEQSGGLTPERLLNANRDPGTPLHDMFEWDDTEAAEKYRISQARLIIRSIAVDVERETTARAFVRATSDPGVYTSLDVVIQNADMRLELLKAAKRDAEAFIAKYKTLDELASVCRELSDFSEAV